MTRSVGRTDPHSVRYRTEFSIADPAACTIYFHASGGYVCYRTDAPAPGCIPWRYGHCAPRAYASARRVGRPCCTIDAGARTCRNSRIRMSKIAPIALGANAMPLEADPAEATP